MCVCVCVCVCVNRQCDNEVKVSENDTEFSTPENKLSTGGSHPSSSLSYLRAVFPHKKRDHKHTVTQTHTQTQARTQIHTQTK